jgi:proteic killer suppression protein
MLDNRGDVGIFFTGLVNDFREPVRVEVLFSDPRLRDICASDREMRRAFGEVRARKVQQRLRQLHVAETLEDMRTMAGRCHLLKGDHEGYLALDLDGPYRLIFKPTKWMEGNSGGLDWLAVQSVVVSEIVDYH